jgi:hypothetical protein
MAKYLRCLQEQEDELKALRDTGAKKVSGGESSLPGLFREPPTFNPKAGDLAEKIEEDLKQQNKWEVSAWSLSNSSFRPGESIEFELGNGVVAVRGTIQAAISRGLPIPPSTAEPDQKTSKPAQCCIYMVTAPPEIRSRILMEGLRHDLNNFAAILQFDGKSAESDSFWISWKSAWFDAQEVFCKYNQGAQFTDLNGEVQTCKT